jgi:hypothetical protein
VSFSPSTIALRCFAIPSPCRYLLSASASAALTCKIFSASAFSAAASRKRTAARDIGHELITRTLKNMIGLPLISFILLRTKGSGVRSTTKAAMIS